MNQGEADREDLARSLPDLLLSILIKNLLLLVLEYYDNKGTTHGKVFWTPLILRYKFNKEEEPSW